MKLPSFSLVICSALKSTMHEHVLSPFSVQFFAIPGTVALQAPLSMGFSMHETGITFFLLGIINIIWPEIFFA